MALITFDDIDYEDLKMTESQEEVSKLSLESKEEIGTITNDITQAASDVMTIHDRIIHRQGVCRQDIVELQQHVDKFSAIYDLLQKQSPYMFTEEPSQIGLPEAMESLESSVLDIIIAGIKNVVAFVVRVIKAFWDFITKVATYVFSVDQKNVQKVESMIDYMDRSKQIIQGSTISTEGMNNKFERDINRVLEVESHNHFRKWNLLNHALLKSPDHFEDLFTILGDILLVDMQRFTTDLADMLQDYYDGKPANVMSARIRNFSITPSLRAYLANRVKVVSAASRYSPACMPLDLANDLRSYISRLENHRQDGHSYRKAEAYLKLIDGFSVPSTMFSTFDDLKHRGQQRQATTAINRLAAVSLDPTINPNVKQAEILEILAHAGRIADAFGTFHEVLTKLFVSQTHVVNTMGRSTGNVVKAIHKFIKENQTNFDVESARKLVELTKELNSKIARI